MSLSRVDNLISWARQHGGHIHEQVEVHDDPEQGISLRVGSPMQSNSASNSDQQPLGRRSLKPMSRVVSCPFDLSLSFLNALNKFPELRSHSARFPALFLEILEPHVIGHFFLIQQYLNADVSHWGPYVKFLPQPDQPEKLGTPLYFSEADLAWIRGTDLGVARDVREKNWRLDWERGCQILDTSSGWEIWQGKWTWDLYKWAATIFSSRSFISTLIPEEVLRMPMSHGTRSFNDIYPVLFPLLDLANHNSDAKVTWFTNVHNEPKDLSILVESEIPYGQQIFNNYAPKSNTELMLGYGFSLPGNDEVQIAFKPLSVGQVTIRRQHSAFQKHLGTDAKQSTFYVRTDNSTKSSNDKVLSVFEFFENGCVDTLSVLTANQRERDYMVRSPSDCLERMDGNCSCPLSRNLFSVISVLIEKLETMLDLIRSAGENLGYLRSSIVMISRVPGNSCQRSAKLYRDGQISVLQTVTTSLRVRLDAVLTQHWVCNISSESPLVNTQTSSGMELVTLRRGFNWLRRRHRELYDHTIFIIAKELEVTVVPDVDWLELTASGWDYTIWCLWIHIALRLHMLDIAGTAESYVTRWVDIMFQIYNPDMELISGASQDFCGDRDEYDTLKVMVDQINPVLCSYLGSGNASGVLNDLDGGLLSFASMIAMEETIVMGINMKSREIKESDKEEAKIYQRVLYMSDRPIMYGQEFHPTTTEFLIWTEAPVATQVLGFDILLSASPYGQESS